MDKVEFKEPFDWMELDHKTLIIKVKATEEGHFVIGMDMDNPEDLYILHWDLPPQKPNLFIDLTGKRFGKLTVLEYTNERRNGSVMWLCKCDCGNTKLIRQQNLTKGNTVSCGCFRKENSSEMRKTGFSGKKKNLKNK
jgi:hypothetical protein